MNYELQHNFVNINFIDTSSVKFFKNLKKFMKTDGQQRVLIKNMKFAES